MQSGINQSNPNRAEMKKNTASLGLVDESCAFSGAQSHS